MGKRKETQLNYRNVHGRRNDDKGNEEIVIVGECGYAAEESVIPQYPITPKASPRVPINFQGLFNVHNESIFPQKGGGDALGDSNVFYHPLPHPSFIQMRRTTFARLTRFL